MTMGQDLETGFFEAKLADQLDQMWNPMTTMDLNQWSELCHLSSQVGGWWKDKGNVAGFDLLCAAKIALIHSEVSECLEGIRKGQMDDHLPLRKMEEVEAADILVRLFDLAGARGWDLMGAMRDKMMYNQSRRDHKPEVRAAAGGKKF